MHEAEVAGGLVVGKRRNAAVRQADDGTGSIHQLLPIQVNLDSCWIPHFSSCFLSLKSQ